MKADREQQDAVTDRAAETGPTEGREGSSTPLRNVAGARVRALLGGPAGRGAADLPVRPNRALAGGDAETRRDGVHVAEGVGPTEEVLAHEAAHAMQQRADGSLPTAPRAALEADAARVARDTVAGRRSRPLLRAPRTSRLGYEAWEHTALGDARGGTGVTVVTRSGVELTYGQIVALSGDFYRSPEALMNASATELNELKAIMGDEAAAAEASGEGRPSEEQISGYTERYEIATSRRGSTAEYHRHDDLETLLLGDEEGHRDHGGHDDHEEELVENAGRDAAHGAPEPEASFLELAAKNASHFSPENIRNNYRPGQDRALELARRAWQLRNPDAEPAETTAGTLPSAREGTLPATGAEALVGPPAPAGGADTTARRVDATSDDEAERLEAEAWLTNGWANHYLTDAFASGHLVNGNVGRRAGVAFVRERRGEVAWALSMAMLTELPGMSVATATSLAHGLLAGLDAGGKLGSMALKLVHDVLNQDGLWVKDARGIEWVTMGDKVLAESPQTQAQAEEASRLSREAVQDVLRTGGTNQQMRALDLIPDVARFGGGGYQPIATFAEDESVFTACFERTMLSPNPEQNKLYEMIAGNLGLIGVLAEQGWIRHGEPLVDEAVERGGELVDRVGEGVAETAEDVEQGIAGFGSWVRDTGAGLLEDASGLVDDAGELVDEVGESVGEGIDRGLDVAEGALDQVVETVRSIDPQQAYEEAVRWLSGDDEVEPLQEDEQTYAHGAFMGAAPAMVRDPRWGPILLQVDPLRGAQAMGAEPADQMTLLENHPVLAAYGTVQGGGSGAPGPVRLEWDVWLDEDAPGDLDAARIAHGSTPTTAAHGVVPDSDVFLYAPEVVFGARPVEWLRDYDRAIRLALGEPPAPTADEGDPTSPLQHPTARAALREEPGGIFLDVKSRWSTAEDVDAFVQAVEGRGANVIGVGTFQYEQVSEASEEARGRAPLQVKFFHGLDDLSAAVRDGDVVRGDQVMFNGGVLLEERDGRHIVAPSAVRELATIQRLHALDVGVYVQEYAAAPDAVEALTLLVRDRPGVFELGFAYGNVAGRASTTGEGTGMTRGQEAAEWVASRGQLIE